MKAQRIFLIVVTSMVVLLVGWYIFIYQPLKLDISQKQRQLSELNVKINSARRASADLTHIEQRLKQARAELDALKERIVYRRDISEVTKKLSALAVKYNVEITDFSPALDSYFEEKGNEKIKPLPIALTVVGRYLEIGRFVEHFDDLDFFLVPREIVIEKTEAESNDLMATVTSTLYTWNE